jgi:hypothetical protein
MPGDKTIYLPCPWRQGLFLFLIIAAVNIWAEPSVDLSVFKEGNNYRVTISGDSIGMVKSSVIVCKYDQSVDVDNAFVGSPIASLSFGVSIDRVNKLLVISLKAASQLNINDADLVFLKLPISGIESQPVLILQSASFTDPQNVTKLVKVKETSKIISENSKRIQYKKAISQRYYLLNGSVLSGKKVAEINAEACRNITFKKFVKK